MKQHTDVLIVGGGAIGVCAAHYLTELGREVTIVERGEVASGCSYANAGLVVPSHSIPFAAPGVIAQGLRWMTDPKSPFYVRPRLSPALFSWMYRFYRNCRPEKMRANISVLKEIGFASLELLQDLVASENLDCEFAQNGWLLVFRTESGYRHGLEDADLLLEYAIESTRLNPDETLALEPALQPGVQGGILFPNEAHLDPAAFVKTLAKSLERKGVTTLENTQVEKLVKEGETVVGVQTPAGLLTADQVVLAGGAWTPGILKSLNIQIPIQPAKGYSVSLQNLDIKPKRPLYLSEAKVAVTPLEIELRLAGTLELAGMDLRINQRRVDGILEAAHSFLKLAGNWSANDPWSGVRPCTPDGLPVIAPAPDYDNLIIAAGHCMLGITLAPVTGLLVAQLANGLPTAVDLGPFAAKRF